MPSLLDQLSERHPNPHPRIIQTSDSSYTIYHSELEENYHSLHGARQESEHIFINNGLKRYLEVCENPNHLSILEVGFGTGLNMFLTADFLRGRSIETGYHAIEPYPLPSPVIREVNRRNGFTSSMAWQQFFNFYEYNQPEQCSQLQLQCELPNLHFHLHKTSFIQLHVNEEFDLIYYDAFSPNSQPDMWDEASLKKVADLLKTGGMMITYCIRGHIKRTFKQLGLCVQALPGAKGKREMLRVIKPA